MEDQGKYEEIFTIVYDCDGSLVENNNTILKENKTIVDRITDIMNQLMLKVQTKKKLRNLEMLNFKSEEDELASLHEKQKLYDEILFLRQKLLTVQQEDKTSQDNKLNELSEQLIEVKEVYQEKFMKLHKLIMQFEQEKDQLIKQNQALIESENNQKLEQENSQLRKEKDNFEQKYIQILQQYDSLMNKTKSSNSIEVMNGEDFFKSTDSSLQRKSRSNSMYSL